MTKSKTSKTEIVKTANRMIKRYGRISAEREAWGISKRCENLTRVFFWERVANTIRRKAKS